MNELFGPPPARDVTVRKSRKFWTVSCSGRAFGGSEVWSKALAMANHHAATEHMEADDA